MIGNKDINVNRENESLLVCNLKSIIGKNNNNKIILIKTTEEKTLHMDITRWSILKSDWLYSLQPEMEKLSAVSKNKTRSWLRS